MSITDFYTELMQDVIARSGSEKDFYETVFTEYMCDFLVEQAAIEDYTYAGYRHSSKSLRVDAWNINPETELLTLFITDFRFNKNLETLTRTDINKHFRRAERFFSESLTWEFHQALEESATGYELARDIFEKSAEISKVNVILLSNTQLSTQVKAVPNSEIEAYPITHDIWEINRLFRLESSGKEREDIVVDLTDFSADGIPCLPAFTGTRDIESYLLVMPGTLVAELYGEYGERLLEQNVRTFLQFRGKVNKGIRNTINNEPEMFFAYNNGLTATAEHIETDTNGNRIISITNLQIVNGGQTTASIFTAMKKSNADLSNVYVQVKLTIIPTEQVLTVVPKISEYANTQNKVSAADFFSNHPFHLRIEEISRRLWASSPEGGLQETHWFYERTRGQYANAQANLTPAKKREFKAKNPRNQMFTKTDLAKFEHSYSMIPNIVSRGAQKNFAEFANRIGREWGKKETQFNEIYFKRLVAKAVLFRYLDKNIMKQPWYGGYKANIVTYSLAKLVHMISDTGQQLDLLKIWNEQKLPPVLEDQLLLIAADVNEKIQQTPAMVTNVTEWCKKEACWSQIQDLQIELLPGIETTLIDSENISEREKNAERTQRIDNGIKSQAYVIEKGADYWKRVAEYGLQQALLSNKEKGILTAACKISTRIPTEKQSTAIINIEKKMIVEGFVPDSK